MTASTEQRQLSAMRFYRKLQDVGHIIKSFSKKKKVKFC